MELNALGQMPRSASFYEIWAGIKWFCKGLGLSERQMKSERKKIQEDIVLSKGGRNLILPANGGEQVTLPYVDAEYIN